MEVKHTLPLFNMYLTIFSGLSKIKTTGCVKKLGVKGAP